MEFGLNASAPSKDLDLFQYKLVKKKRRDCIVVASSTITVYGLKFNKDRKG